MTKKIDQMAVRYRSLADGDGIAFKWESSLNKILTAGNYAVEIEHYGADVGLPIEDCGTVHSIVGTLVVTDSGALGNKQGDRVIGQVLTFTLRESKETSIYTRTYTGGEWGEWCSLARTGMYDEITNADALYSTVTTLAGATKELEENLHAAIINYNEWKGSNAELSLPNVLADDEFVKMVKSGTILTFKNTSTTWKRFQYTAASTAAADVKSYSNWKELSGATYSIKQAVDAGRVQISTTGENGGVKDILNIAAATTESAGVMSAEDKKNLNLATENEAAIKMDIGYLILEQGGINVSNGNLSPNGARVRTKGYIKAPFNIELNDDFTIVALAKYDKNGTFIRFTSDALVVEGFDEYLYKFSVKRNDGANFTPNDDIVKNYHLGLKYVGKLLSQSISKNKNVISKNSAYINGLGTAIKEKTITGIKPASEKYENLSETDYGDLGADSSNHFADANKYFQRTVSWNNTYDYCLSAVLLTDISDMSVISKKVILFSNYGRNDNYKNVLKEGLIAIDDTTAVLYSFSGRIESKDNSLPTTNYLRVDANTDVSFGIMKFLCVEVESWDDSYISILKDNVYNNSVWYDGILSRCSVIIDRALSAGIAFWGSSSTEGSWVTQVAANLDMPYYRGGVGGENIWAIMGRMGVLPLRIETPFTIPASASEIVAFPENYALKVKWKGEYISTKLWASKSAPSENLLINPCYIAGVKGNLIGGGANSDVPLQFQRLEDGAEVTTKAYEPIYTFGFRETRDCVWFLACHFNGGQSSTEELVELYRKMYDTSCSKKVLILGRHKTANGTITSPTLETLQEQEAALEDEFGLMFFNTREYMCGRGFERFKELYTTNYTDADVEQASQGVTPDCMYESASNVHFNSYGYAVLTEGVTDRLKMLGYDVFRLGGKLVS